jgi:hypothetical protein
MALIKQTELGVESEQTRFIAAGVPLTPRSVLFLQKTNLLAKLKKEPFVKLHIWGDGGMAIKGYRWDGFGIEYR